MKRGFAPDFFRCDEEIERRKADDTDAPSSSATPKGSNSYDVFLSFRGIDTRNTFVDHLYNNLVDAGIHLYKDGDELREGEEIGTNLLAAINNSKISIPVLSQEIGTNLLAAIKNSKISIPVLSQNYASSKWCLQEIERRKADDTGAPSSSATPKGSNSYDVFLSFRGTDTRNTFVDHLYNNLVDAGICVFKDDDELREGEEISTNLLAAIKNSKISILVLSQNYASSKWCLQELVQMIECMKSDGQVVLPIFYRVEPADVRHQKGSFGEAFSHLRGKYSEEDVAKWKEVLQEVASLKGWESDKTANGLEGELAKMVIRIVLSKLKEAFQLVVTEQLVGIDNSVADILRLLDDNPNATQIVDIHGMGGIGKTTLAKVV